MSSQWLMPWIYEFEYLDVLNVYVMSLMNIYFQEVAEVFAMVFLVLFSEIEHFLTLYRITSISWYLKKFEIFIYNSAYNNDK